jgi:hypothetical protein
VPTLRSPRLIRLTCTVLAVLLVLPAAPQAQRRRELAAQRDRQRIREPLTPANPGVMRELLGLSAQWVKDAERDEKRLRKEQQEATKDALDDLRGSPGLRRAHESHRKSLYTAGQSLQFEKDFSLELQRASKAGLPDGTRLRVEAARVSSRIQRFQLETERELASAEAATARAPEPDARELYAAAVANYERSGAYLERWRLRYDAYLAAAGVRSTSEFLARAAERVARAREAAARKQLDDEKKSELLAALLVSLAVAVAVTQATAKPATPKEIEQAEQDAFNAQQLRLFGCQLGVLPCV